MSVVFRVDAIEIHEDHHFSSTVNQSDAINEANFTNITEEYIKLKTKFRGAAQMIQGQIKVGWRYSLGQISKFQWIWVYVCVCVCVIMSDLSWLVTMISALFLWSIPLFFFYWQVDGHQLQDAMPLTTPRPIHHPSTIISKKTSHSKVFLLRRYLGRVCQVLWNHVATMLRFFCDAAKLKKHRCTSRVTVVFQQWESKMEVKHNLISQHIIFESSPPVIVQNWFFLHSRC